MSGVERIGATPALVAPAIRLGKAPLIGLFLAPLIVYPLIVPPFWALQIGAQTLILGTIGLSVMFLAGYGGMVSLAQMTVAGVAGYMVALFGASATAQSLGWPWWLAIPLAIAIAVAIATLIGALSARTQGIYTIMITLALAVAFFYLAQQNYDVLNGFDGFKGVKPPALFGVNWREPEPFFYLSLAVAALSFAAVVYLARSTFGLTLQGLRDNARRMRAIGYNVTAHQIVAYALAGLIAAFGGVLAIWFHERIGPSSIGIGPVVDILIIAVLGGLRHPIGPFVGALVFVLIRNFAIDLIDRERFNTLIGLTFLVIVLVSQDGLLGLWDRLRSHLRTTASGALR